MVRSLAREHTAAAEGVHVGSQGTACVRSSTYVDSRAMSLEEADEQANAASARCKLARVGAAAIPDLKAALRCLAVAADAVSISTACCAITCMVSLWWQLPASMMRFLTIVARACDCVDEYVWTEADTGGTACSQKMQARDD